MMRLVAVALIILGLSLSSGCATLQPANGSGPVATNDTIQQLQSKVNSLELELARAKDENFQLRKKVEELSKSEMRMPNAKDIQTALKKAGFFKGEVDGQIGSKTKEAIRKFQEANGITPDGVVGSKTWALLSKYLK
jgi:murein L,D-transpeptidase YcbB/YkuD